MKKKKGIYFRVARKIVRLFIKRKLLVEPQWFEGPKILIGHHQNFYGPLSAMFYMPDSVQIWTIEHLFDFKLCYDKYYHFTFRQSMNLPKLVAAPMAYMCAIVIPPFVKQSGAIPVYRGSRDIIRTFQETMQSLEKGYQVLIFPDADYTDTDPKIKEIYPGFLNIEKQYYKHTRQHIEFLPILFHRQTHEISNEQPIFFTDEASFTEDKKRVELEIIQALNRRS